MCTKIASPATYEATDTLEASTLLDMAAWIVGQGNSNPDHACAQCRPDSDMLVPEFVCAYHTAAAILACTQTSADHIATVQPSFTPLADRLPLIDAGERVLVFTEGTDFDGAQFFDIRADNLYPRLEGDDPACEVACAATHWMAVSHLIALCSARPAWTVTLGPDPEITHANLVSPNTHTVEKALSMLRMTLSAIPIVGNIDGHDVIRRDSVIELTHRTRAAFLDHPPGDQVDLHSAPDFGTC
ncbi:hypothetical protein ACI2UK_13870 [Ralstonia nicotianae]|uniref:hypothetical protein n=1 Tax=Ralstonia pseudosolanacearum TaxID=1310165 RepID=UPI0020060159|nr:hypothetical protein [Ralstonia pseudosolanacearum]MCK4118369.1 hypothetical protein [Ralstonia pseudosolanacearum]